MSMLVMFMMVLVMVPMIECKSHVRRHGGAQVIEVQAGATFHGRIDDLQVCR